MSLSPKGGRPESSSESPVAAPRHGEHYSDFNELRRAKARFAPRWDPRFVSSRPGLALARAIPDLAKLVAGSSPAEPPEARELRRAKEYLVRPLVWLGQIS